MSKKLQDLGIVFDEDNCMTCLSNSCHNNVVKISDNTEYSVHIRADFVNKIFYLTASLTSSTHDEYEIEEVFNEESKIVEFLCGNFEKFKCA